MTVASGGACWLAKAGEARAGRDDCFPFYGCGEGRGSRKKKGQMVFEFVIATLFFLAIVMYTINVLNSTVGTFSAEHRDNILEVNAWKASEVITRSPGVWVPSGPGSMVPGSLGLAEEWPVMDEGKIGNLSDMCAADMDGVLRLLDVDPAYNEVAIRTSKFTGAGEVRILECGDVPAGVPYSMMTRFGVSGRDGRLLKTEVWYY